MFHRSGMMYPKINTTNTHTNQKHLPYFLKTTTTTTFTTTFMIKTTKQNRQMTASRALQTPQRFEPSHEQQQLQGEQFQQQQPRRHQRQQQQPHRTGQVNYLSRQTVTSSPSSSTTINNQSGPYHSSAAAAAAAQIKATKQQQAGNSSSSFASARSATPLSRPGSSVFGTPTSSGNQSAAQQTRTISACSNASTALDQQQSVSSSSASASASASSLGQCRICRKIILANELCHLCSNCNQFICEDCASYSSSDKVSLFSWIIICLTSPSRSSSCVYRIKLFRCWFIQQLVFFRNLHIAQLAICQFRSRFTDRKK